MVLHESKRITVVGAGFMGCVIATMYSNYGYEVVLNDVKEDLLNTYAARALPIAAGLARSAEEARAIVGRVTTEVDFAKAVDGASLVHETIHENLDAKRELFNRLDALCVPEVILATNTSSFLLSDICKDVHRAERTVGIHYVTPAHVIKTVEIIKGPKTSDEVVQWAKAFVHTLNHVGIVCEERPGFIVNRLQFAMLMEIYRMIHEGYAVPDDIDEAVRGSLGPRLALWGPLMCEDLVASKSTMLAVTDYLGGETGQASFDPSAVLRELVSADRQGATHGKGWYNWKRPYPELVEERDRQLADLFEWLEQRKSVESLRAVKC
ncbi:3-hydroxyacyl-CoA dehydrogenase family protein [Paraburkholderia sediminicola]|uniref:3-hydroxyacyl-CoA dehydrogenase family protein n=1 Tax=Paraburkholderia sediminicola TaxID=458836 RepID=UPI0038BDEB4B